MTKQKSLKENLRVDYYLLLKYCRRQCALLTLHGPNHLQLKFYTAMHDFKRISDLIAPKKRIEQLNFFDWLSNVKSGFFKWLKHVRNVIQWD